MKTPFIIVLITVLTGCFSKNKPEREFPTFSFLLKDSTTVFNSKQIPKNKPFVLAYFSPDCKDCQQETEDILKHMNELKDVNFYFLTNDSFDRLKVFDDYYKIYNYKNVVLGWDNHYAYIKYFKPNGIPYSILFDSTKKVKAVFAGQLKCKILIDQLKKL